VQLVSAKDKFICGWSSGGIGLSFLQEDKTREVIKNAAVNNRIFILNLEIVISLKLYRYSQ
jgi:hypothetical protein